MQSESRIKYFPVSFFSVIMGLCGFTIAVQKAEGLLSWGRGFSTGLAIVVAVLFILLSLVYAMKIVKYYPEVQLELENPAGVSFFAGFTISILLLGSVFIEISGLLSRWLMVIGMVLHLLTTLKILALWVGQSKFEILHFNPSWFIPVLGNMIVPVAGTRLFHPELSWFFYSIGLVFWVVFFTILLYRLFFHPPLPEKLKPTLFIMIVPPAMAFISYVILRGGLDSFARILYYFALFIAIFLFTQWRMFWGLRFYLSWWAYSFPVASITIASAVYYSNTGLFFYKALFFALLLFFFMLIAILLASTCKAYVRKEICVKE